MNIKQNSAKYYISVCCILMLLIGGCKKKDDVFPKGEYYIKFTLNGQSKDFRSTGETGSWTPPLINIGVIYEPSDIYVISFGAGNEEATRSSMGRDFEAITVSLTRTIPIVAGKHVNYIDYEPIDLETYFREMVFIGINYMRVENLNPVQLYLNIDEADGISEIDIREYNADYIRGTFKTILNTDALDDKTINIPISGEFYMPVSEIEFINPLD